MVADYWDEADREASKKPLNGFGSNTIWKYCDLAKKEIVEKTTAEYGEAVASTGIKLLDIPKLVMRFKIL